jgi:uncharacterized protein (TIGR00251 family)
MLPIRETKGGVCIDVLVQPRASREKIGPVHDERIKIAVTAPPVEGAANAAVAKLIARALGCPRGDVEVIRGMTSRRKTVRVLGVSRASVEEILR